MPVFGSKSFQHAMTMGQMIGLTLMAWSMGGTARAGEDFADARLKLQKWIDAGTAAGFKDVTYDNRDGGHSLLNLGNFPGTAKVPYAKEEVRTRGWGLQTRVMPGITFGNSSTAAPPYRYGSHVRAGYSTAGLMGILYQQYTKNNIYVYPEHEDHDPGHNGKGGYGDLMPVNTPYLIGTQGSSGSDQAGLQAVGVILGSFPPATRKRLVETGLLMPTVQMIFRSCQKDITSKADYLSGKAHPTVFIPSRCQYTRMADMAHAMNARDIPSLVQLKVMEEETPRPNVDYFEPAGRTEKLCDTPCAIGRIFRGRQKTRRMVVSAEDSLDINGRLRKFHWVVLRGDPALTKIVPKNDRASVAEITVSYQPRAAVPSTPKMESNRVDIGVFIDNGRYLSAPGFVCFFSLDNERRRYGDMGNIMEMDYTTGNFIDRRLTCAKPWRDVYHYRADKPTGWTRHYADGRKEEYTDDGRMVRAGGGEPVIVDYRLESKGNPPVMQLKGTGRM